MLYPEDQLISKLSNNTFRNITIALNNKTAWRKILEELPIFTVTETESPVDYSQGEEILVQLINKECTIKNLYGILKHCKLYEALSIIYNEPIRVSQQPSYDTHKPLYVKQETPLTLEFVVHGIPLPKYYWYHNNILLVDQISERLYYEKFIPSLEGEYYCIALQTLADGNTNSLTSNHVNVEVQPERCCIIKKPPPEISRLEGDTIILEISACGYPEPQYEWTHVNKILANQNSKTLKVRCTKERQGEYKCRVWNRANEVIVQTKIQVLEVNSLYRYDDLPVVKKVALLIGNQNYENLSPLSSPANDVNELSRILDSMGFIVYKLLDAQMRYMMITLKNFCDELVNGAYAFLYFAGHGFEFGEKYLLPIDCPDPQNYGYTTAICEYFILREVLRTKPKLFFVILDMCLVYPNRKENFKIFNERKRETYKYESNRNLIQCYATTSGLSAYETRGNCSLFISVFKKYLVDNISVLKMLAKTNEEFEIRHKKVNQQPCITYNVTKDYYLNAPLMDDSCL